MPLFTNAAIVGILVGFAEVEVRQRMKQAGGRRNQRRKVWELCDDQVVALKLAGQIVEEEASNTRDQD